MGKRLLILLCLFFCALAALSGAMLLKSGRQEAEAEAEFARLRLRVAPSSPASAGETAPSSPRPQEVYGPLSRENPDFRGWIRIPGTSVDYPVVQNGDYYLSHGFDGGENPLGVPFLAPDCDLSQEGAPLLVYGHNTKKDAMFSPLTQYVSRDYYEDHPVIQFDTTDRFGDYRVFAVFLTTAESEAQGAFDFTRCTGAVTEEAYREFTEDCRSRALYETQVFPAFGEQLLVLVTCEYSVSEGRIVVAAVGE